MSDLRELYQELIIDHSKKPHNFKKLEHATCHAEGYNPLCGDKYTVYAELEDGKIKSVSFQGAGCAISMASASMMTDKMRSKTPEQAEELFQKFHDLVTGATAVDDEEGVEGELGKLAVFAGVREYPSRVKCASLPWHTLRSALKGDGSASTE